MFYQFNHLGSPDYLKVEYGKNFNFPLHLHRCYELVIVLSGEMQIAVDNKEYILKKDESLLIFPNQIHSFKSQNSEHFLAIFSPNLVKSFETSISGQIPQNNKFSLPEDLIKLSQNLKSSSDICKKKGILYLICDEFNKSAHYISKNIKDQTPLFKMFLYVEKNFAKECNLRALAEEIGYDYSYLSRLFKRMVGMSFNTYINHYRLSNACYLMENTNNSILHCAIESGYSSLRNFNRNFKNHFDITPTLYKQNLKLK